MLIPILSPFGERVQVLMWIDASNCCPPWAPLLRGSNCSSLGACGGWPKCHTQECWIRNYNPNNLTPPFCCLCALSLHRCSSCSAEIAAETAVRLSREPDDVTGIIQPCHQSACVAMTTRACGEEACTEPTGRRGKADTECVSDALWIWTPASVSCMRLQGNLRGRGDRRNAAESHTQGGLEPGFMVVNAFCFFLCVRLLLLLLLEMPARFHCSTFIHSHTTAYLFFFVRCLCDSLVQEDASSVSLLLGF